MHWTKQPLRYFLVVKNERKNVFKALTTSDEAPRGSGWESMGVVQERTAVRAILVARSLEAGKTPSIWKQV